MPKRNLPLAKIAKQGEKTIEVTIRFFTDEIADKADLIIPKHAWDSGMIYMCRNKTHGIKNKSPKPFNSILDLTSVLSNVLMQHGITLHTGRKLRRLISK